MVQDGTRDLLCLDDTVKWPRSGNTGTPSSTFRGCLLMPLAYRCFGQAGETRGEAHGYGAAIFIRDGGG